MKIVAQVAVVAVVAVLAGSGWYFREKLPFIGSKQVSAGTPVGGAGAIPVEVARARIQQISSTVEAVGTAYANESVSITAKTMGTIRRINFQEGQKASGGTVLVELEAGENDAKLEELRSARDGAENTFNRNKALVEAGTLARARLDDSLKAFEQADARLKAEMSKRGDLNIRAPFAGRLGMRSVSLGALVRPGDVITTLDDSSTIKLEFDLPETVLQGVQPGTQVIAKTTAFPDRTFTGTISLVEGRIDPVTRAFKVRALIPNQDEVLKPGLFMTTVVNLGTKNNAVVVPEESIMASGGGQFVYLIREGKAVRSRIRIGQRTGGMVEIVEGVKADDTIAIGGLQFLRDGAQVRVVPSPGQSRSPTAAEPTPTPARS